MAVWTPDQGTGGCLCWTLWVMDALQAGTGRRVWGEDATGQVYGRSWPTRQQHRSAPHKARKQETVHPISLCDVTITCVYIGMSGRD